ncbi:peptidase [Sediminicola luteus]|uniref:Peptidase n=2 Tax=Sediminicola luteus TaxID=319238 RepID=A0A2A4G873_9FLAO|nr:zinc-dependent metalloprotease [Sediminicola luteus]PCE64170.1 peptidase [Sediminicola luteus]
MRTLVGSCLFILGMATGIYAQNEQKFNGFFDFSYSQDTGKLMLEVSELDKEFLYVYSLSSGVGSNDLNLDRGQLGNEQVVYFKRAGNKLLLVQPNQKYRAITDNVLERKSVEQAFAKSVLFGFPIVSEKNGVYTIDMTPFLMQDAHGVSARLKSAKQGDYKLDKSRSAVDLERTKAFPNNVEFNAILTFTGAAKGKYIKSVAPNAKAVTVEQHHSFIELPDADFVKREFDPRSGSYPFTYMDYATPVQEQIVKRYITRHRLAKKDPTAAVSEAVEPIVYYLDNGTPEPVRSALLEGGRWWNQAFEAIGYKDAFQFKILPDDADPMDVRYNVVQWVHRSTRGWSYGSSVTDPRTGEIIKGHVSLGSLRIRQDFLIAQALMDKPFAERDDNYQPMLELALARIRQLSAHEIGHTLGFAHNFAASTNNRASVMDYPHPVFGLDNGTIDFSNAYATDIGDWDKVTVAYSYSDFASGDEKSQLNKILDDAYNKGLRYISDSDARPKGGAHVLAHLWDNGKSAAEELDHVLAIRKTAMQHFSKDNIRTNEAYSALEDVFAPLFFFHRYQTEAVAKVIGGLDYNYAVKNGAGFTQELVDVKTQKQALTALLRTLDASELAIPKEKLALFPPRAMGYARSRESIKGKTGVAFDALAAPETAADMSLGLLLHPERTSRLIQQQALDAKQLGLEAVLDALIDASLDKTHKDGYYAQIQQTLNYKVLEHLMRLAADTKAHPQVNAITFAKLKEIRTDLLQQGQDVNGAEMVRRIDAFMKKPESFKALPAPQIPDGSPIGMDCFH